MEQGAKINPRHKGRFWVYFLVFSVIIVILATLLFLFVFSSPPEEITKDELLDGVYLTMRGADVISFYLGENQYELNIRYVGIEGLEFSILDPIPKATLLVGEIQEFDLDNDNNNDVLIKLKEIIGDQATIFIQKTIEEEPCIEYWECTDFSICINGLKKRVCLDQSSCGSEEFRPEEELGC